MHEKMMMKKPMSGRELADAGLLTFFTAPGVRNAAGKANNKLFSL